MVAINFPDSPTNGQEHSGYVWDATNNVWNRLPTLPALDLVNFSAVAPSNPQDGQFWFDTTAGKMYVYYNDGSSAQWVSTLGGLVGQTGTEGQILVHNGTEWLPSDGISHNAIINGDFGIWQRGTSFSGSGYNADRFRLTLDGTGATRSVTRQAFSPGELEVSGYGAAEYFLRYDQSVAGSGATFNAFQQYIEDVKTFAGQQVTFSFWAKAASATTVSMQFVQKFGSGGSSAVFTNPSPSVINLTTSWVRYESTVTIPSVSGKTIGSGSFLEANIYVPNNATFTVDLWGIQLEAGSVATPFRLAGGGSKAAELALCQRYYYRQGDGFNGAPFAQGRVNASGSAYLTMAMPVQMRILPSSVEFANLVMDLVGVEEDAVTAVTIPASRASNQTVILGVTTAGGMSTDQFRILRGALATNAYLALNAEL